MKAYWGVDVQIHIFLTLELAGGELSASHPGRFTPWERAPGTHWIERWMEPTLMPTLTAGPAYRAHTQRTGAGVNRAARCHHEQARALLHRMNTASISTHLMHIQHEYCDAILLRIIKTHKFSNW
jgi:hypothetical protein